MREYQKVPFLAAADASGEPLETSQDGRSPEVIVDVLESMVVSLERLISDRSADELQQAARDGGWGAVELLAHMRDWEEISRERVRRMLEEDPPVLEEHDDSLWAIEHDYGTQDGHEAVRQFADLRRSLVERLRNLDDDEWQRTAVLPSDGEITLMWLMSNLTRQDGRHLDQIREALG
ncbi:MAG TPA: DinB family protein [Thermomicrobiales bacterium]|nr:DinB family protein [Thermomicrobiales bacterium]